MQHSQNLLKKQAQAELAKRELARRKLLKYVKYNYEEYDVSWHHKLIIEKLEAVERGEIKRLMLFLPPRHGKSELGSIQFPSWFLGKNPNKEVIACSYSADLAVDFGRKTRNLVHSKEYQNVFQTKLSEDSQSAGRWNTQAGGAYVAVGVGGGITGKGADLLIIDDPVKNREDAESEMKQEKIWDWYRSTAYTRLSPDGAVIVIMTRWHDDDLGGRLLMEMDREGDQWDVVNLPALAEVDDEWRKQGDPLWPKRYNQEKLEKIKKAIGTREWTCLYQQYPLNGELAEFKRRWFRYRKREEAEHTCNYKILTIDPALSKSDTGDYTGWAENYIDSNGTWNLSTRKLKINGAELINLLFNSYETHRWHKIGIEKEKYLIALKPFIEEEERRRNIFLPIEELSSRVGSKEMRIRGLIPRYERGAIYHIENECSELEGELVRFPLSKHDDVMDAVAYQAYIKQVGFDMRIEKKLMKEQIRENKQRIKQRFV